MSNWNNLYGQKAVVENLTRLLKSDKIPHALLFNGLEGTGKDFAAVIFAQALNQSYASPEKINFISKQIAQLNEPYIKYIIPLPRGKNETDDTGPVEKLGNDEIQLLRDELSVKAKNPYHKIKMPRANFIKISSIRDIKKFIAYDFSDIKYRIILISDAHLMNEEAQNALLKNLEEPPDGVIFILTTPYPGELRETIRSRCWLINFQPLSSHDVKEILINNFEADKKAAETAASFSGGSVTEAVKLIEYDIEVLLEKTILILRYSFGRKFHSALKEFSSLTSDNSKESIQLLIKMIIIWLNDIQKEKHEAGEFFFEKYKETLQKFNSRFPDIELKEIVFKLDRLASSLNYNVNVNTVILNLVQELADLTLTHKNKPLKSE